MRFGTRYLVLTTLHRPDIEVASGQPSDANNMQLVLRPRQESELVIHEVFRHPLPSKTPTFLKSPQTRRDSRQLVVHSTRRQDSQQVDVLPGHLRPSRSLYPEGGGPRRSDGKRVSSPPGERQLQRRRTGLIVNDVSALEKKPQLFDTDSLSESEDQLPDPTPSQLILAPRQRSVTPPRQRTSARSPPRRTTEERTRERSISSSDAERGAKAKPGASDLWTEITKDLVTREAVEQLGYDFHETDDFFYILEYLRYVSYSTMRRFPLATVDKYITPVP